MLFGTTAERYQHHAFETQRVFITRKEKTPLFDDREASPALQPGTTSRVHRTAQTHHDDDSDNREGKIEVFRAQNTASAGTIVKTATVKQFFIFMANDLQSHHPFRFCSFNHLAEVHLAATKRPLLVRGPMRRRRRGGS